MKIDAGLTATAKDAAPAARALEAQGFDAAWTFEAPRDPFFPIVLASQVTERIELGTSVAIAFARNPMICANIGHDLQEITGGRFILGLGSQIKPHIERRFSQPWSRPAARMREFVQAIRAIWAAWNDGERLAHRGEFYTHTLMTPAFSPGVNPYGPPRIFVAGVGPKMVGVAGEVADGFFVHPFHSPDFLEAETLPALEGGLDAAGRSRADLEVSCPTIAAVGSNDEQIATARRKAKGQISFYGSTPAYKGVLDFHGYEALQPELNRMSRAGKWAEMSEHIDDRLFDLLAVSGTPAEVGARIRTRNESFADRTTLLLYNETEPDAVKDIIAAAR